MDLQIASAHQAMFLSGTYAIAAVYLLAYVIVVSHRIFGPMISIRNVREGAHHWHAAGRPRAPERRLLPRARDLLTDLNKKVGASQVEQKASS
jgi:hypothetical protein